MRTNLSVRRETAMPERASATAQRPGHICSAEYAGLLYGRVRRLINRPKRILRSLVAVGDTVVDLGCGPGFFTLPLAELVGTTGRVIAVDVQEQMLAILRTRAEAAGLDSRIQPQLATNDDLGVTEPADFALAFWVLHETPDHHKFLQGAHDLLKPDGSLLLVEPIGHVSKADFSAALAMAREIGFVLTGRPRAGLSRAALLRRP